MSTMTPTPALDWGDPEAWADFLTGIAQLVTALAWPLVLLFVAWYYRDTIVKVAERLKLWKGFGQELELLDPKQMTKLEDATERAVAQSTQPSTGADATTHAASGTAVETVPEEALELLRESGPAAVVLNGWERIDGRLRDLAGNAYSRNMNLGTPRNVVQTINALQRAGVLTESTAAALMELRETRNLVAHDRKKMTDGQSLAYALSVNEILHVLDRDEESLLDGGQTNSN